MTKDNPTLGKMMCWVRGRIIYKAMEKRFNLLDFSVVKGSECN